MDIKNLLDRITAINIKFSNIAKITGENYNIFQILKVDSSEVRLHSAFLANLMNPDGSHERGNIFAVEFVELLKKKSKVLSENNFLTKSTEIIFESNNIKYAEIEHWLGYMTETEGGYIDILLIDKNNNKIIIENKIYAGDQENQLLRYHSFDPNAPIIYLTLDGKLPSEFSTNNLASVHKNLICLSYESDILKWLEACKKHTVDYPLLRETITQYIYLIKHLTHQTMSNEMEKEITNSILSNTEWIVAAEEISTIWIRGDVKNEIMKAARIKIGEKFADVKGLKIEFLNSFGRNGSGLMIYKEGWEYCIYFCFYTEFQAIWIGIAPIKVELEITATFKNLIREKLNGLKFGTIKEREDWVWVSEFGEWQDISWKDVIIEFPIAVFEATHKILACIKDVKM